MKAKTITLGILRALGIIVAILLFCLFVYKIQSVIVYIAIAAVISLIGRPIVWFLKKRLKIPIKLAVIIVLLMVTAIFIGIIVIMIPVIPIPDSYSSRGIIDSCEHRLKYKKNHILLLSKIQ